MDGFNPELLKIRIEELEQKFNEIFQKAITAGLELGTTLQANWASPKAVQFSQECFPKYEELVFSMMDYLDGTMNGVCEVGNEMAQANAHPMRYSHTKFPRPAQIFVTLKERGDDGSVVMNLQEAQTAMLEFSNKIEKLVVITSSNTYNLPICSQDNAIQDAFNRKIQMFIQHLNQEVTNIKSIFNTRIQENIAMLKAATQQAQEALNGNYQP